MKKTLEEYPYLASLMSGWFHQDFDIEGETIDEIIRAYKKSCAQDTIDSLIKDITRFSKNFEGNLNKEFENIFNPDVELTGFSPTTRDFLNSILANLTKTD